ncbi:MAG TPA: DinB family protein [Ktedonobacterales bacterium]|nr:DinB family protein [Ktedonobacterales bacterium]
MADRPHVTIEQLLALLAATPLRLAALTAGLAPAQLRMPVRGEWSANDVLAHLRACADVWGDCITAMLAEDHPTLRAINPRTWIKRTDYPTLAFAPSLAAFAAQRAELLAALEPLPPAGWSRAATVTGAGGPLERTVDTYARWLVRHERRHVKQIAQMATELRG